MSKDGTKLFLNEGDAISRLSRNGIKINGKNIPVGENVGLKMWSAIDYLCYNFGFTWTKERK